MSNAACAFEKCERKAKSKLGKDGDGPAYCQTHYVQYHKNGTMTPIRSYTKAPRDEKGRVCTGCGQYKEYSEYYDSVRAKCKECHKTMYK